MSDELIDIRTPLAASKSARVEVGNDGVLHVLAGPVTLHMDRATCEEFTTTLARAMLALAKLQPKRRRPQLALVADEAADASDANAGVHALPARSR